jgi:hypothetical protein
VHSCEVPGDKLVYVSPFTLVEGLLKPLCLKDRSRESVDVIGGHSQKSSVVVRLQAVAQHRAQLQDQSLHGALTLPVACAHRNIIQRRWGRRNESLLRTFELSGPAEYVFEGTLT